MKKLLLLISAAAILVLSFVGCGMGKAASDAASGVGNAASDIASGAGSAASDIGGCSVTDRDGVIGNENETKNNAQDNTNNSSDNNSNNNSENATNATKPSDELV